jgi:hypothetical protein
VRNNIVGVTVFAKGHDQIRVSQEDKILSLIPAIHFEFVVHVGPSLGALAKKSSAQSQDQLTDLFEP